MEDIEQKIILNYKTNADDTSKSVNQLTDSVEATTEAQKANNTETKKEEQAYKSMRVQIKEATIEYQKLAQTYGVTSKEALNAAQNVARLKDELDETKDFSDAFNPDQKMTALATSAKVAGIGLQGVTSGIALFGEQNEDVEKQLLKVQAAMAFSDSIAGIFDMAGEIGKLEAQIVSMYTSMTAAKTTDVVATEAAVVAENQNMFAKAKSAVATGAMTAATSVATAAQWLWNVAIMANPVAAIAVAIAAAVAGIYLLTKALMDSSAESEKAAKANTALNKEVDALTKSSQKSSEQLEINGNQTIALAKASGKSAAEIRKLSLELANQEMTEKRVNAVKAYSILLEAQRVAGLEDSTDAQKETAKKALESYKTINTDYEKSLKDRNQVIRDNKVAEVQEETDKQNKLQDERNKANEKRKAKEAEERKKRKEEQAKEAKEEADRIKAIDDKKLADEMKSAQDAMSIVKNLQQSQETPAQKETREYEEKKAVLEANNLSTEELTKQHNEKMRAIELEEWGKESESATERTNKEIADEQVLADAKNTIQNAQLDNASKGISLLQSLGIKNKAVQKGLLIAESASGIAKIVINTMAGNAKTISTMGAVPAVPFVAQNTISGALGVATSIAATAKGLQALGSGGGSSGGGTTMPAVGSAGGSAAPQVGFQSSNANQIATTIADNTNAQPIIKAIVVANEVTTAQSANRNKIEANSI